MKKFYITTPLYYVNAKLHIGHTYTTVFSDIITRFKKLDGYDVCFLTGSDEHGEKIYNAATAENKSPKQLADENVGYFVKLWDRLNIKYDKFIRTTDTDHEDRVQKIIQKLFDKGYIYKGKYNAYQCIPCESFWTEDQLAEGKCPSCRGEVNFKSEENYFFAMSKLKEVLKKKLNENKDLIKPQLRYNEIMGKLETSMDDKSISRANFKWGVPLPFDNEQVAYVWFDAIMNYITAICYPDDMTVFEKWWPCDLHVIGKDILWFHTLFWYSILEVLELPHPVVYAHGFWLLKGGKMSKRTGITIDPFELSDKYGVDTLRYFLISELPETTDTEYDEGRLVEKYNNDLVNTFSNLIHRTFTMCEKYLDGRFEHEIINTESENKLIKEFEKAKKSYLELFSAYKMMQSVKVIMDFVRYVNGYIEETAPFRSGRDNSERTASIIYSTLEAIRIAVIMLYPIMPITCKKILEMLKYEQKELSFENDLVWGKLDKAQHFQKGEIIFQRL